MQLCDADKSEATSLIYQRSLLACSRDFLFLGCAQRPAVFYGDGFAALS
jgi:hypothetical protein